MSFMSKAGFAVVAVGLAAGSVFGAGAAQAANLHGAIAISGDDWAYGSSVNASSFEEARDEAMAVCGAADCEILISWSNGCAAIVESNDGAAAGAGATSAEAQRAAFQRLSELTPTAQLANFGSSDLSGAKVVDVICTANAR
ncbi:DUF4189 domain-containing protein [Nocardia sp. NPDC057663]|uniref:DUF4189 domain-containing protein n=1 Tax=Nocardia sp. NPDC057663 TaxID=3346201 RepID=UPI0036704A12